MKLRRNHFNLHANGPSVKLLFLQDVHLLDIMLKLAFAIGKLKVFDMIIIMQCSIVFQTS